MSPCCIIYLLVASVAAIYLVLPRDMGYISGKWSYPSFPPPLRIHVPQKFFYFFQFMAKGNPDPPLSFRREKKRSGKGYFLGHFRPLNGMWLVYQKLILFLFSLLPFPKVKSTDAAAAFCHIFHFQNYVFLFSQIVVAIFRSRHRPVPPLPAAPKWVARLRKFFLEKHSCIWID